MQCVNYVSPPPNGFEETFQYSALNPYAVNIKTFQTEDIVPLHYAETIEILLCDALQGELVIDSNRYTLGDQQVFVIPPRTVHSNNIRPGNGTLHILQISFQEMERYFNIRNFLMLHSCSVSQLDYCCPDYDAVCAVVNGLKQHDGDLFACLPLILQLFSILSQYRDPSRSSTPHTPQLREVSLQALIRWTYENYSRKITIEEAAQMTGYSKYHFCNRFKTLTGMTYLQYLNTVRVSKACLMLRSGASVQTVCRDAGFENVSHFIQVFKRIQHTTPHKYASHQKQHNP